MPDVSAQNLEEAVARLRQTTRGRNTMRRLLEWLDDDGLGLDAENQFATMTIIKGAWGSWCGTTRDLMRQAIADVCEHGCIDGQYCEPCNRAYKAARQERGD
jgi:hypothetical protein